MNDLREIIREPSFLEKMGFVPRDDGTADVDRWVWYEKTFDSIDSQLRFIVQVEFELAISDNRVLRVSDNFSYSFNGVYLRVIDRQMERWHDQMYDDERESPREIDRYEVNITTVTQLRALCRMLSPSPHTWGRGLAPIIR